MDIKDGFNEFDTSIWSPLVTWFNPNSVSRQLQPWQSQGVHHPRHLVVLVHLVGESLILKTAAEKCRLRPKTQMSFKTGTADMVANGSINCSIYKLDPGQHVHSDVLQIAHIHVYILARVSQDENGYLFNTTHFNKLNIVFSGWMLFTLETILLHTWVDS